MNMIVTVFCAVVWCVWAGVGHPVFLHSGPQAAAWLLYCSGQGAAEADVGHKG